MTLTLKQAQQKCRAVGITLRKYNYEYRVNYMNGREETAYYTNDIIDAVQTAFAMAAKGGVFV